MQCDGPVIIWTSPSSRMWNIRISAPIHNPPDATYKEIAVIDRGRQHISYVCWPLRFPFSCYELQLREVGRKFGLVRADRFISQLLRFITPCVLWWWVKRLNQFAAASLLYDNLGPCLIHTTEILLKRKWEWWGCSQAHEWKHLTPSHTRAHMWDSPEGREMQDHMQ